MKRLQRWMIVTSASIVAWSLAGGGLEPLFGDTAVAQQEQQAAGTKPEAAPAVAPMAMSPHQMLEQMDPRQPVPMRPGMAMRHKEQMRDHLAAVQEIVAAMAKDDYAAAGQAAGRIGSSAEMAAQCRMMGAGAPGYSELASQFHTTADRIVEATKKKDRKKVFAALGDTLGTCVSCHAAYKQQIEPPPGMQRGGMGQGMGMGQTMPPGDAQEAACCGGKEMTGQTAVPASQSGPAVAVPAASSGAAQPTSPAGGKPGCGCKDGGQGAGQGAGQGCKH